VSKTGLVDLLRIPARAVNVADADWNEIVVQGTDTKLLGQLAAAIGRAGCLDQIPRAVRLHLGLAELTSRRRSEAALWEVRTLRQAIDTEIPVVVLKGCAYAASTDLNAAGRIFSDVDVLVPREFLDRTEGNLIATGWNPSRVSAYDQHYYRDWMHEVPPMEHVRRHTTLDLHHAINPPVSRVHVPTAHLLADMVETMPGVFVLGPIDRVVHCALHLVQEGDPTKLLRDLYDLHLLLEQHCTRSVGLDRLWTRARALGVLSLVQSAQQAATAVFSSTAQPARGWLGRCIVAASGWKTSLLAQPLAALVLLAYSHWIKMPVRLLVPHLLYKARLKMKATKN